ncbi:hypothetical protein PLICRDRAFT_178184 [Plicaturopsis crispa FD-325 SS-3]|nr:hypothetical protein PLICRDRAFT_178184 [Plicaturopsis crispa FD-325 SS-3]
MSAVHGGCLSAILPRWKSSRSMRRQAPEPVETLDCSVESLPPYVPGDGFQPELMKTIASFLDKLDPALRSLSLKIHGEFAHDTLTAFMEEHGFTVTRHYLGLDTAWRAEFSNGKGGRTIGVNSEMDALPGIGHACGHNLIAASGAGIALAVKAALEAHGVAGSVVLLGTPAEEAGAGKSILLSRGGYRGMDACVIDGPVHHVGMGSTLAIQPIEIEFFGHTAHAAAAPWEGINALDAAFMAYSAVSVLRQQLKPTHRVHGTVQGRDWAANIIPDYAKMTWFARAPTLAEVKVLTKRVQDCFQGAALSTGCRLEMKLGQPLYDLQQNSVLSGDYLSVVKQQFGYGILPSIAKASTDFVSIDYAHQRYRANTEKHRATLLTATLPAIHPQFTIPTEPNGGNHTPAFAAAAGTPEAHEACITTMKALAYTGFRVLNDDDFYARVKSAFAEESSSRTDC